MWDSDTTDAGVAQASCAAGARCADIVYGATGTPLPLALDGTIYHVRGKLRSATGAWTRWSTSDWFQTAVAGQTISGFAREVEGASVWSGCAAASNVSLAVNGVFVATTTCSAVDGSFSFSHPFSAPDQVVTVYLDDGAVGNDGVLYTRNVDTAANIIGLEVVQDRMIVRSESPTAITNADINRFDATQDPDPPPTDSR
jgi:hypothetical protein